MLDDLHAHQPENRTALCQFLPPMTLGNASKAALRVHVALLGSFAKPRLSGAMIGQQHNLGVLCFNGDGVPQDYIEMAPREKAGSAMHISAMRCPRVRR